MPRRLTLEGQQAKSVRFWRKIDEITNFLEFGVTVGDLRLLSANTPEGEKLRKVLGELKSSVEFVANRAGIDLDADGT